MSVIAANYAALPPLSTPSAPDSTQFVTIYHPVTDKPILNFVLHALPHSRRTPAPHARPIRCAFDDQSILGEGDYYYCLDGPGATQNYEINNATFESWRMPAHVPLNWEKARTARDARAPAKPRALPPVEAADMSMGIDGRCLLTGTLDRLQAAHLIPSSQRDWFDRNPATRSAGEVQGRAALELEANLITLRADVRKASFDQGQFVVYPWGLEFVTFFVRQGGFDLVLSNHGRTFPVPRRTNVHFLHARFVWIVMNWLSEVESMQPATIDRQSEGSRVDSDGSTADWSSVGYSP
ncbi:hypothetical protein C8R46DRAFT_1357862 [Mycena filopes]|nr:hypothetical protein C8R46DRAFT_1357862 [Mycena filopes]